MEQWKEYKIGDVCDTISETYRGTAAEVVLINTSDVLEGKCLNHTKSENKDLRGQFKKTFRKDDILYSEIRPANKRYAYVDFYPVNYIASTKLMVLRHNEIINPHYLFYIPKSNAVIEQLQRLAESRSGTFPQITFSELANLPILLPNLSEQNKILSELKSLDEKIELNRRINDNLEQQVQALFKAWFVDFEPFKDGEFIDSELGLIPKGWRVGTLDEVAQFKRGKTITQKDTKVGNIPVIAGGLEPAYYHNVANTTAPVVTISASGANAGFTQILFDDVWASDCSYIDSQCVNLLFAYCFLSVNTRKLRHAQVGATQPHVYAKDVNAFKIALPNDLNILRHFTSVIEPIFHHIANNRKENSKLSIIRDCLLPRLMSGELKTNDLNCI
ncbi:MAG: restriction endonuclease subunit S [Muribaculaceae bacterium]